MDLEEFKGKLLEKMNEDKEENEYEDYVVDMVDKGYIDYDGEPIRCPHCGSKSLEGRDHLVGGMNAAMTPDGALIAYSVFCKDCGEQVAHWEYGLWDYSQDNKEGHI